MNVLHVVNIYFVLPYFIGDQFRYFADKGHKLNVVCSKSPYLGPYSKLQGFDYIETEVNRSISIKDDIRSIYRMCKYIKEKKIDIVVGHTPKGALLAMIAAYIMRVPKRIYFRHGLLCETSKGFVRIMHLIIEKLTSLCATHIICVSPSLARKSLDLKLNSAVKQSILNKGTCGGIDALVKYNPQRIDPLKLAEFKVKWNISEDDFVIGYCGRLVKDKGIIELIEAFKVLQREQKQYKLLLVGMFEERDALPESIQLEIKNNADIVWTDFVNEDQEYFYSMMDICTLLSYREGFGMTLIEAQAMQLPVLATNITGCCDAILDTQTGYFVSHDSLEIADKIRYIRNNNLKDELGKNGREWVVENFDNRIVWRAIEKLYM